MIREANFVKQISESQMRWLVRRGLAWYSEYEGLHFSERFIYAEMPWESGVGITYRVYVNDAVKS